MDGSTSMMMKSSGVDAKPIRWQDVIRRATGHLDSAPDAFTLDQQQVGMLVDAPDPDRDLWLDGLSAQDARELYPRLEDLADEHRRRANAAEALSTAVRDRLRAAAGYGLSDAVAPQRG